MWTKIFMKSNNPLVRVSLTLQKRKAIKNKVSRRHCWIPNASEGWAVLLNNRIYVFRDLSHSMCLFFPLHKTVNCISDENEKCITQNYFLHFLNCTLSSEKWKFSLFFFPAKYISITFLHDHSRTAGWRKKNGHRQIPTQQLFFRELTRCSKVQEGPKPRHQRCSILLRGRNHF